MKDYKRSQGLPTTDHVILEKLDEEKNGLRLWPPVSIFGHTLALDQV